MVTTTDKNKRPFIISGPCGAESERQLIDTCTSLASTGMVDVLRAGLWKPRTYPGSFEGVGAKGLEWLVRAREITGLPVAVEVATAEHVASCLDHGIDILWIGSRSTVSPFTVQEICDALRGVRGVKVLVKNPMNPDAGAWAGAVNRLMAAGMEEERLMLVHRGFSYFGESKYRNTPMWQIALEMRNRFPRLRMLCDPSHIAGDRALLAEISQTAADLGYDGLMIESHIDPDSALSDSAQQVSPDELKKLLESIHWRVASANDCGFDRELEILRNEIDRIDSQIFELIGSRMALSEKIGGLKRKGEVAIFQKERWNEIVEKAVARSVELGLSPEFTRTVLEALHMESISHQNKIMNH